jgi:integrase
MGRGELNQTFTKLIGQVGLEGRGARARPRPHDLRHTLAVRTLIEWYRAGEDIDRRMPLLSTYLGHVDPASTYWYLEAVPELLELIGRRLEQLPGVLS